MTDLIRPIAETKRFGDFFVDLMTRDLTNDQTIWRVRIGTLRTQLDLSPAMYLAIEAWKGGS